LPAREHGRVKNKEERVKKKGRAGSSFNETVLEMQTLKKKVTVLKEHRKKRKRGTFGASLFDTRRGNSEIGSGCQTQGGQRPEKRGGQGGKGVLTDGGAPEGKNGRVGQLRRKKKRQGKRLAQDEEGKGRDPFVVEGSEKLQRPATKKR